MGEPFTPALWNLQRFYAVINELEARAGRARRLMDDERSDLGGA